MPHSHEADVAVISRGQFSCLWSHKVNKSENLAWTYIPALSPVCCVLLLSWVVNTCIYIFLNVVLNNVKIFYTCDPNSYLDTVNLATVCMLWMLGMISTLLTSVGFISHLKNLEISEPRCLRLIAHLEVAQNSEIICVSVFQHSAV